MAHYAIGDIHGCYDEFSALLATIGFNHGTDTLWLTGDIINRGPKSLETLQFVMRHESSIQTVLGNHELHLLAIAYGYGKIKHSDTVTPILQHPENKKMLHWLRTRPLLIKNSTHVLVHAGLLPQWHIRQAQALAREVETVLQSDYARKYFANMYGDKPQRWKNSLEGYERLRVITNVLTRMRAISADKHKLNHTYKGNIEDMPKPLIPWFLAENRQHLSHIIVFGHWSTLGYINRHRVIALDTGVLWGNRLTAINLATNETAFVRSQHTPQPY